MTRRLAILLALAGSAVTAAEPPPIRAASDFGAPAANVEAVARSAARALWGPCGELPLSGPGIDLFHRPEGPIALHRRSEEGRVRVGISSRGTFWAQQAFQFSHELGHVLARHTRPAEQVTATGHHPNLWLEESLCEAASLFALRAMAREWADTPPYPNWKAYAPSLADYARQRLEESARTLAADQPLRPWLDTHLPALRRNAVQRELNNVVAARLLPVLEAEPSGWESLAYLNLGRTDKPEPSLREHLAAWRQACPGRLRPFITRLAAALETPLY